MSNDQLKTADFYNICVGNIKQFLPDFFDKETYVFHYATSSETRIKTKRMHPILRYQSQCLKIIFGIHYTKK